MTSGKKALTVAIFEAYGLPGWLGWGTAGAESTWGTNGSYAFGGIDLPNSGGKSYALEARESAKAYAGLIKQYGSIAAAVTHYSGNSYTIDHVRELARGGASEAGEPVPDTVQVGSPRGRAPSRHRGHREPTTEGGVSGPLELLLTLATVLGGAALVILGVRRSVGAVGVAA